MKTNEQNAPQLPVPNTLGGGTMTIFRCGGPKLGDCTAPGCAHRATLTCKHPLIGKAEGKTCDKPVCEQHGADGLCPSHQRLVEQQKGKVRAWL